MTGRGERHGGEDLVESAVAPAVEAAAVVATGGGGIGEVPLPEAKLAAVGNRETSPTSPRSRAATRVLIPRC